MEYIRCEKELFFSVFTDESQVPRTMPGTQFLLDKYFLIE